MSYNPNSVNDNTKIRHFVDRLTKKVVTSCGIAILLVMLLLFFWLVWVIIPLFSAPNFQKAADIQLHSANKSVLLGTDKKQQWGWRIDEQGNGEFISLARQPAAASVTQSLLAGPVHASLSADHQTVLLLAENGDMLLARPDFSATDKPDWHFPIGKKALVTAEKQVQHSALAQQDQQHWVAALATAEHVTLWQLSATQKAKKQHLALSGVTQLVLTPDGRLLFTLAGKHLQVWALSESTPQLRDDIILMSPVKTLALLSGGNSLLVAGDTGIEQWFDIAGSDGLHLQRIRSFAGASWQPLLLTEAHRRVFATLSPQGELNVYASKQPGSILNRQLAAGVQQAQFSPDGDGLLIERNGHWQSYQIHNPWPDLSWHTLWQKVWYENYPEPEYVWQSTSANDDYQGKFSLVPMVSGTLKAAGLAMLFATPLALAAAMYSAWFMSPKLRRWIKPAIEMMGALPSVVIGLIAGLWLAPRIAERFSGVLLLPICLTIVLLLCSWGRQKLPYHWRKGWLAEGREVIILLPILLLSTWLCLWGIPFVEHVIWGDNWVTRLDTDYQQRNLLVAGVAMGFALVPLIFTLAEDAIFSVPAALGQGSLALGATQWQTLIRVVLPGASSGIFAALMIGFGRALGETMIVLMATGNTPETDGGLLQGLRSLAANIVVEMPEAAAGSAHYRVLFLSALVLLVFTLIVNTLAEMVRQRLRRRYNQQEVQG